MRRAGASAPHGAAGPLRRPADLAQAYKAGKLPLDLAERYLDLAKSPFLALFLKFGCVCARAWGGRGLAGKSLNAPDVCRNYHAAAPHAAASASASWPTPAS